MLKLSLSILGIISLFTSVCFADSYDLDDSRSAYQPIDRQWLESRGARLQGHYSIDSTITALGRVADHPSSEGPPSNFNLDPEVRAQFNHGMTQVTARLRTVLEYNLRIQQYSEKLSKIDEMTQPFEARAARSQIAETVRTINLQLARVGEVSAAMSRLAEQKGVFRADTLVAENGPLLQEIINSPVEKLKSLDPTTIGNLERIYAEGKPNPTPGQAPIYSFSQAQRLGAETSEYRTADLQTASGQNIRLRTDNAVEITTVEGSQVVGQFVRHVAEGAQDGVVLRTASGDLLQVLNTHIADLKVNGTSFNFRPTNVALRASLSQPAFAGPKAGQEGFAGGGAGRVSELMGSR